MNKMLLSTALFLILAACGSSSSQPPLSQAPLYGATIGGPFTLIDQDGKKRSDTEFAGKYRIIYFGYTNCPDICSPDMQNLMAGLKRYEKSHPKLAAQIQPIFITVDPERDTSPVLKQFVSAFHPRLLGLTGSASEIALAAKAFAIPYARVKESDPDNYLMSHAQMAYLMGPDGKPISMLPLDALNSPANESSPEAVEAELAKWVR